MVCFRGVLALLALGGASVAFAAADGPSSRAPGACVSALSGAQNAAFQKTLQGLKDRALTPFQFVDQIRTSDFTLGERFTALEALIEANPKLAAQKFAAFRIPSDRRAPLAFLLLKKSPDALAQNIGNLGIDDEGTRIALARGAAQTISLARTITDFRITDQAVLAELARQSMALNPHSLGRDIGYFRIDSEDVRFELALSEARLSERSPLNVDHYYLKHEHHRIAVAMVAARQSSLFPRFFEKYRITDPEARLRIALEAVAHHPTALIHSVLRHFHIQKEEDRYAIALGALASGQRLPDGIGIQLDLSEEHKLTLARIVASQPGNHIGLYLRRWDFTNQAHRLEIARLAAKTPESDALENLDAFQIDDPADRLEIAANALFLRPVGAQQWLKAVHSSLAELRKALPPRGVALLWLASLRTTPDLIPTTERLKELITTSFAQLGLDENAAGRLFWQRAERQDVIYDLLGWYVVKAAQERGHPLEADSIYLWMDAMGLGGSPETHDALMKWPGNRLGELMALGFDINRRKQRFFEGMSLPPALFLPSNRAELLRRFTMLRDYQALAPHDGAGLTALASAPQPAIEEALLSVYRRLFENGSLSVNFDQITALQGHWGDLSPILTLLARFRSGAKSGWHKELPLLGQVFQAVLEGRFEEYKFSGAEAAAQTGFLSPEAQAAWRTPRSRLDFWDGNIAPRPAALAISDLSQGADVENHINTSFLPHLAGVMMAMAEGMASEDAPPQPIRTVAQLAALSEAILSAREAPTRTVERLVAAHGIPAVLNACIMGLGQRTVKDQLRLGRFAQALAARLPEHQGRQLREDGATLVALVNGPRKQPTSGGALIFTTSFHDPKLLLTIGDLVQVSSCQNYRTGGMIHTLLGYVVDAGVRGVASWVLSPASFENPNAFERIKGPMAAGEAPRLEFNGPRLVLTVHAGGEAFTTKPLGYAHLRHVLKLGRSGSADSTTPGLFLERAYAQPHDARAVMDEAVAKIAGEYAGALGAGSVRRSGDGGPALHIAASRNPGGVYSDGAGGVKVGAYEIQD